MSFERPTLAEVVQRVESDFASILPLTGAIPRRSVVAALARALAGATHGLHGRLDFLGDQVLPSTAEGDYLARWADIWGISRLAATYANGTITVSGTNGTDVPSGTIFVRADGERYESSALATISGGTATVTVDALTAGADPTLVAGDPISLESPIAGITTTAEVLASVVDGTDQESDEALRARLQERISETPQGGSESDYVAWAKTVAGVTRAWVYPQELGIGTVTVRFVRDDDVDIIPSGGEVTAVQNAIDALRPVTADVTVVAPSEVVQDFTIAITPDTTALRTSVEGELEDLLRRELSPGGTLLISQVMVAVGTVEGITDFEVTSPAADVVYSTGELPTMGTVTWT